MTEQSKKGIKLVLYGNITEFIASIVIVYKTSFILQTIAFLAAF